jgi:hypothetical protein
MASTRKAVSGNVQRLKNAATIFGITQTPSSNVTNSLSIRTSAVPNNSNAGYPLVNSNQGRKKSVNDAPFCYQEKSKYVVMSGNVTIALGTIANTSISGGASFARRAIAYALNVRTSYVSGISWVANRLVGPTFVLTKTSQTINVNMGGTGTDTEAALSPTVRGNIVFQKGSTLPYSTNYKNLTLW